MLGFSGVKNLSGLWGLVCSVFCSDFSVYAILWVSYLPKTYQHFGPWMAFYLVF